MGAKFGSLFIIFGLTARCLDTAQQTFDPSALLNSSGPRFAHNDLVNYQSAVRNMRRFYRGIADEDLSSESTVPIESADYIEARAHLFAYIDYRCDAYIDAIFWANRTRGAAASTNSAIGSATEIIVGSTGGSVKTLSILAAAFGLNGSLFEAYYDSVLYGLNPSGIQKLVDDSRRQYRASDTLSDDITSEGELLIQVQGYIRVCTPAYIEYLVNESISAAQVVDTSEKDEETEDEETEDEEDTAASPAPVSRFIVAPTALTAAPTAKPQRSKSTSVPVLGIKRR